MTRIHLDTDLGGDPDDACALAMLLGWPGADLVGITTTIDPGGQRAADVAHCLRLAGRDSIPLAAGAEVSSTTDTIAAPIVGDERHWPTGLAPRPSPPGGALDLLAVSIGAGATIVAIGPLTNLARLETARPGILGQARIVVMGGWIRPPAAGLPAWGPAMDWNIQWDTNAAEIVAAAAGDLTLVTLPATLKAHLRAADLPRLRASGPLGALLARQSEAHGQDEGMIALGRAHAALPDDLLNFHYDPVTCAVALGWPGAVIEDMRLRTEREGDLLRFRPDSRGRPVRVAVDVDGPAFMAVWLAAMDAAQRGGRDRERQSPA
ncbi:MAG TPA: nucleoside hydrolase [Thermomicrobiales bacterium]|nr:nucleoside hydrolase [Thermomicrobiales bacterium]